jgi:hypothetical protein
MGTGTSTAPTWASLLKIIVRSAGFLAPAAGEDVDLVRRLAARVDITWAATVPVATWTRLPGRLNDEPGGRGPIRV